MIDIRGEDHNLEWYERTPRPFHCCDGMCGQLDCERCHPEGLGNEEPEDV
jgi:hypothetical protein